MYVYVKFGAFLFYFSNDHYLKHWAECAGVQQSSKRRAVSSSEFDLKLYANA